MKIECARHWGQPKLIKPKACNKKNLLSSVSFGWGEGRPPKCKVWRSNNTIYVLHRDWFSPSVSWEDAISRGIIKPEQYREKFIYKNNYSGVILRNEAVISFPAPDLTAFILDTRFRLCVHAGRGLDGPVRFAPLGGFFHGDTKTATINCIEGKYANAENQSP